MTQIKPILFSTEMVKAILDGRKTMTRRVIKSRHESGLFQVCKRVTDGQITVITSLDWDERPMNDCTGDIQPKYKVGDVLWVRETFRIINHSGSASPYFYKADACETDLNDKDIKWKPSIFMPREACRIFLEVTNVRAEKLGDISADDSIDEGIELVRLVIDSVFTIPMYKDYTNGLCAPDPIESFKSLWRSINGDWNSEQWVWVYSFKRIEKPEIF